MRMVVVFEGEEYRRIKARQLWENHFRRMSFRTGILFGDTINANNLWYREKINAVNPWAKFAPFMAHVI